MNSKSIQNIFKLVKNILPFAIAIATFWATNWASHNRQLVEDYYSQGLYPSIATTLSWISHWIRFSLWDIFWISGVVCLFIFFLLLAFRKLKFWLSMLRLFQTLALVYAFFYIFWGFNYFRQPIAKRMDWHTVAQTDSNFVAVFDTLVANANRTRSEITKSDYELIDKAIEKSYRLCAKELAISYPNGSRRPKTMLLSSFFAKSGVSGYFGPLLSEVHVNGNALPVEYPFTLAHEKAHQFGITSEAEANFIAWYVCSKSDNKMVQYSGNIQIIRYFLSDIYAMKDAKKLMQLLDKKLVADIKAQQQHWAAMRNATLDKAQTAANDVYLKSNRISDGVQNYNSVVLLTITWFLNQKGAKI